MKFHPIADLFPLMSDEEYAAMKQDIAVNGLREPITLYEGKILDGRNRQRICDELGIEAPTRAWDGNGSPIAFVLSENAHRRHLTKDQLAVIAIQAGAMEEARARAKERERAGGGDRKSPAAKSGVAKWPDPISGERARDDVARQWNTSPKKVQAAANLAKARPKLLNEVVAGTLSLAQASREVKRTAIRRKLARQAAALRGAEEWEIRHGDCLRELPAIGERARLIFADPPYNLGVDYGNGRKADLLADEDYLAWCARWMGLCANRLTADGSFWVMICDEWADRFGVMLTEAGLTRRAWVKWYETFGVNCANNFNRCSRHLFYYVADPKRFVFHAEAVARPSDRQTKYGDKRADPDGKIWDNVWQIPRLTGTCRERIPDFPTQLPLAILRAIVGCCSEPGDLVIDPFSGSATTGVAAVELGRRYVGIEKEKRFCKLSRQRLAGTPCAGPATQRCSVGGNGSVASVAASR